MVYFDLKNQRSYRTAGATGKLYLFKKGTPTPVSSMDDILKFKGHKDIFIVVDKEGNQIVDHAPTQSVPKSYSSFKKSSLPKDPEDLLADAFKQAVEKRKEGVDVNKLLEEAKNDLSKDDKVSEKLMDMEQNSVEIEDEQEELKLQSPEKSVTKIKKSKSDTECELCSRKFKTKKELDKHLEDHEDED